MARVYRAQHEGLQRQVALKVLLDGHGKDGEGHERFLREARIVAAIKHPNVVNIFDVGVHQGKPYLVMELLEGMDLEAYVASQGSLDEPTLMDVIIPIVAGLAAVHDAGIVHRDLKPGNIFLARSRNDEMEPKLLDFGISKSSGPDKMKLTSSKGLLMGTPFYMSPEASQGLEMTALSDQYALGVVLYEAASGSNPFAGANTFGEVVRQVTTGDYPPVATRNPRLSKRMVAIIERAMHLDPARRFSDMRAMGRELLALAGQRTRITWGLSFSDLQQAGTGPNAAGLKASGSSPNNAPTRRNSQRPSRISPNYVVPAALLAAAALAVVWQRWPRSDVRSAELDSAPASPPSSVAMYLRRGTENPALETAPAVPPPGAVSAAAPSIAAVEPSHPAEEPAAPREDSSPREAAAREAAQRAALPHETLPRETLPHEALPRESLHRESGRSAATSERRRGEDGSRKLLASARTRAVTDTRSRRSAPTLTSVVAPRSSTKTAAPGTSSDGEPDWVISRQGAQIPRGPDRGTNNAPILD